MFMKQKLTHKEEEVMDIIWSKGEVFIRDIVAEMPDPKPNYNTVATQVKFLEEKGFVVRKPVANSFRYTPAVPEREYRSHTIRDMVAKHYHNSFPSMISQFVEEEDVSIEELKAIVEKIERSRK